MKESVEHRISRRNPFKLRVLLLFLLLFALTSFLLWIRRGPSEPDRYKAQLLTQGEVLDMDKLAPKRTGNEPDGDAPLLQAANKLGPRSTRVSMDCQPNLNSNNLLSVSWISTARITNQAQRTALWQQAEAFVQAKRADISDAALLLQNPPREKGADYRLLLNYPRIDFVTRRDVTFLFTSATLSDAHAGRTAEAYTNALALADLSDLQQEEWTQINQLVRIPIARIALQTYAYGLGTAGWNEPQLAHLKSRVSTLSLLTNTYQALVFSRAQGIGFYREIRTNSQLQATNMLNQPKRIPAWLGSVFSRSSLENDELLYLQLYQARLDYLRQRLPSPTFAGAPAFFQAQAEAAEQASATSSLFNRPKLAAALMTDLSKIIPHLIVTETIRLQTIIAISLERYRLKQGKYPEKLAELIPDYLTQIPQDPMDGRPMRYRLNPDGTFTLWSVGFDGKDDGGDFSMPDPQKQSFPQDAKDIVWPRIDPVDLPR